MGTLNDAISIARLRARCNNSNIFTDANLLSLTNLIIEEIRKALVSIESNLVYSHSTITTVASTAEYTPAFTHDGFLDEGVYLDGEDWFLTQVTEDQKVAYDYDSTTSEPVAYYFTEDSKVGFLWVPDDAYTVHVLYWKPKASFVMSTVATDTLPFDGIFDLYIQRRLEFEMKDILERDVSSVAATMQMTWDDAMGQAKRRGTRHLRINSGMFDGDLGI